MHRNKWFAILCSYVMFNHYCMLNLSYNFVNFFSLNHLVSIECYNRILNSKIAQKNKLLFKWLLRWRLVQYSRNVEITTFKHQLFVSSTPFLSTSVPFHIHSPIGLDFQSSVVLLVVKTSSWIPHLSYVYEKFLPPLALRKVSFKLPKTNLLVI